MPDPTQVLHHYLRRAREALVWKIEGVTAYDARRPLVDSGTNLLGLVKHTASVEAGYLGAVFDRPFPEEPFPWFADGAEPNADMWATPDESREDLLALYRRVWVHSDATIEQLELDAPGRVPWWGEDGDVTLQLVLVHVIAETNRHAGHADIVRELVDGRVGLQPGNENLPDLTGEQWASHRQRLERAAREAAD